MALPVKPADVPEDLENPVRGEPRGTFAAKANEFLRRLVEDYTPAMNAMADWINATAIEIESIASDVESDANSAASSAVESAGYANDSLNSRNEAATIRDQTASIAASIDPGLITNGDNFTTDEIAWSNIRTAFETNSLPWKPIVNLDFARDNYEAYVGLSAGTTRAPLLDLATFSRASSGTGVNAFGNVETVSANQPRIVFENGVAKGILLEGIGENLYSYSENLTSLTKVNTDTTFTLLPNSGYPATLITPNASDAIHRISRSFTYPVAGNYCLQFTIASNGYTNFRLEIGRPSDLSIVVVFDMAAMSVVFNEDNRASNVTIKKNYDGSFDVSFTMNVSTAGTSTHYYYSLPSGTTGISFNADGVSGGYITRTQIEQSSAPSSYIKTEATSVVRAADGLSKTLPAQFNPNANWAIRGEFTTKSNVFDTSVAFTAITDDTAANEVTLRPDASGFMSLLVNANSVSISASSSVLLAYDTVYKFMIVKEGDNYHLYLNGLLAATVVNTEVFDATVVKLGQGRLDSTKTNLIYSDHQIYTAFDYDADFDVFAKVVTGV